MSLLSGETAITAAQKMMAGASLCVVAPDPKAGRAVAPSLVALAAKGQHIIVDVAQTPGLEKVWSAPLPFAAADAKRAHHALLAAGQTGPARWACASVCQTLLGFAQAPQPGPAGSAQTPLVTTAAAQAGLQLCDPAAGLDALGRYATQLQTLLERQGERLKQLQMGAVSRLEAGCVAPIAEMEHRGMPFDARRWKALAEDDSHKLQTLTTWIRAQLNAPNLDVQQDKALLAALAAIQIQPQSARRRDLARLPEPWGPNLVALRTLTKRVQAYGLEFLTHAAPNGRVHPTFAQLGASTGRMACHAPNLQAITKEGGRRGCFGVNGAKRLVIADYKACELRILAHLSEDPAFLGAFAQGQDVHAQVAARIFGAHGSDAERARQRQIAKVVSFGLVYGMGPRGLGRTLDIDVTEAERLQTQYFAQFPRIAAYLADSEATGARLGYATTLSGRRLWLGGEAAPNGLQCASAEAQQQAARKRVARNMPIQGTSADIIKLALARLRAAWRSEPEIGVVNCIHDEIVVECSEGAAHSVGEMLTTHMRQAAESLVFRVPMAVDLSIGQNLDSPL